MHSEVDTLREQADTQQREADEEAQWLREHNATEAKWERRQLEEEYQKVQTTLKTIRRESELARYRAVNKERAKGENRKPG